MIGFSQLNMASPNNVITQDEWTQTLNTGRRRRDEPTGNLLAGGIATGGQSARRWVGNRRVVGQAMGRQQAGSRTGDGSATGG